MRHLKTFESFSINEEFDKFNMNKLMSSAVGVLSTALNLILLRWDKIPGIWKNIEDYKKFMNVLKHLREVSELDDLSVSEWKDLIRVGRVKHSSITDGPNTADLSMCYTIGLYHDKYNSDLKEDIITSIHLINNLDPEKRENLKDVLELIKSFLKLIDNYESYPAEAIINLETNETY